MKMAGTDSFDFEHEVVVREKAGIYFMHIRELGLVVRAEDLAAGYAELITEKDRIVSHYRESGFGDDLPGAHEAQPKESLGRETLPFLIKTAIVAAVAAGFFIWAGSPITNAVHTLTVSTQNIFDATTAKIGQMASPKVAGRKVINGTAKLAAAIKELTPERKAELRESLRVIAQELRPFAAEIRPLLNELENPRQIPR